MKARPRTCKTHLHLYHMKIRLFHFFYRKDRLKSKLDNVEQQISQSKVNLDESEKLLANVSDLLQASVGILKQLQDAPENFETINQEFNEQLVINGEDIENVRNLTGKVRYYHVHPSVESFLISIY